MLFDDAPAEDPVPNLVGLTEEEARLKIADDGFRVGRVDREASDTVAADLVIRQDPNRDVYAEPGSVVDIVVSLGKPEVEVPYVIGMNKDEAKAALIEDDFKVRLQKEDSDEPVDEVLRTDPTPGTSVASGTTITVFWSDGPQDVPDVVGLTQQQAERAITRAGFVADPVPYSDTTEAGRHRRTPEPGVRSPRPGRHRHDLRLHLRAADRDPHPDADRDADAADRDADRDTDAAHRVTLDSADSLAAGTTPSGRPTAR